MLRVEDWLQDPLRKLEKGVYQPRKLKKPKDTKQNDRWWSFHFATRLKLDGADYFCRQVLGIVSMPEDQGTMLINHRRLEWYLGAFFFELMSAYDTLLQELNIVYEYDQGLELEQVRWSNKNSNKFMQNLPTRILEHLKEGREKERFDKIQRLRNIATHHSLIPLGFNKTWWGNNILDASHQVSMHYRDKEKNLKSEDINVCRNYLNAMAKHIISVWEIMKEEFE